MEQITTDSALIPADWFRDLLYAYAAGIRFLLGTRTGVVLLIALIGLWLILRVWQSLRARSLACQAAGQVFRWPERLLLGARELFSLIGSLGAGLPVLLAVLAIAGTVFVVADSLERFDRIQERGRQISELTTVLRNLERRYRVAEVVVRYSSGERMELDLNFFLPDGDGRVAGHQSVELPGSTVYFDALVCNFDYAEIAAGRKINLAIPYRVFSDQLAQSQGVPLELNNPEGIPYMFAREPEAIYGITPEAYHARLRELLALLADEDGARLNGIVRSVYGSAVHRRVRSGDRFTIWVEQSGGLTIKNAAEF